MAKAAPFLIEVPPEDQAGEVFAAEIIYTLKQEHGVHGARLVGQAALQGIDVENIQPSIFILPGSNENERVLSYTKSDGTERNLPASSENLFDVLSTLAVEKLVIDPATQSSRDDREKLRAFSGPQPRLEQDPSEWITGNPLMVELCRRYPQYGNLVRYLCNERGMFLKVGNYPNERAYWNSTTNAGLPIIKKADPVHEGTFMLHDLYHFVPVDPVLGGKKIGEPEKAAYMAHRMMSEASTLVLADMLAVDHAGLTDKGYDVTKRQIYPVYQSIIEAQGADAPMLVDKLLAANVYFCFTGNTKGFEMLGASEESLVKYRAKYESVFRDDFLWNLQNLENMIDEAESNPRIAEYQSWLQHVAKVPTLSNYSDRVITPAGTNIAEMLSTFRAGFRKAMQYQQPINDKQRHTLAAQKYLAGQRIVFARYAGELSPNGYMQDFDALYSELTTAPNTAAISELTNQSNEIVTSYLSRLFAQGKLLPHQFEVDTFAAPLYPVKFVNYERSKGANGSSLTERINSFTHANSNELDRLLEIVQS
jgi:hypothetical protein